MDFKTNTKTLSMMKIFKGEKNRIKVFLPYNPVFVERVKTIKGRKWHSEGKYCLPAALLWQAGSFQDSEKTLEKVLKGFEGENVQLDPILQTRFSSVIARLVPSESEGTEATKQSPRFLASLGTSFEDLRRELFSRKYSYKTVKAYIYFNRDFIRFTDKSPYEINKRGIKGYLLALAEEKRFATSTLNQAINALKFYYGSMLKKMSIYAMRLYSQIGRISAMRI